MLVSQAPKKYPTYFKPNHNPTLLYASNVTVNFVNHPRLLHKHDDYLELVFVRTGFGTYVVGDHKYNIEPGNIIICNPSILHDEMPEYNHHLSMLVIAVTNVQVKGLPDNYLISPEVQPILKLSPKIVLIESIFQTIFDSLSFGTEASMESTSYLTSALLSLVLESFSTYGKPTRHLTSSNESTVLFHNIKQYIDDHYSENLSLQQISDLFFISQSYLSHLFKRKIGFSPIQYITRRRIGEAQLLLVLSSKSITEISTLVGFESLSHFNVQFKRYVGMTPLLYRKKNILPNFND